MSRYDQTTFGQNLAILGVIFAGVGGFMTYSNVRNSGNPDTAEFTVTDKTHNANRNGDYNVFTKKPDGSREVFVNGNNFVIGKSQSTELQGQLEVNHSYKCNVVGESNPESGARRNLVNCVETPPHKVPSP